MFHSAIRSPIAALAASVVFVASLSGAAFGDAGTVTIDGSHATSLPTANNQAYIWRSYVITDGIKGGITATINSGPWQGATVNAETWCQSGHTGIAITISQGGATPGKFIVTLSQADAKYYKAPAKLDDVSDCGTPTTAK
jgi:hypothetical protein